MSFIELIPAPLARLVGMELRTFDYVDLGVPGYRSVGAPFMITVERPCGDGDVTSQIHARAERDMRRICANNPAVVAYTATWVRNAGKHIRYRIQPLAAGEAN